VPRDRRLIAKNSDRTGWDALKDVPTESRVMTWCNGGDGLLTVPYSAITSP
jgi:hypothetical protein